MNCELEPLQKRLLDDLFDAYTMLAGGNMVSLLHVETGVTRYTPYAVELFQLPGEYVDESSFDWGERVHPEDRMRFESTMNALQQGKKRSYDLVYRVKTSQGSYNVFRFVGAVLRSREGKPEYIGGMMVNEGVTNNTDPVTLLPNKYVFLERLGQLMHEERPCIALMLGFQQLPRINEVHGYSYGNRVLQEVCWLIQEVIRERGSLYRMDGGTFAFLTEEMDRQQVAAIYDSLRLKLQRGLMVDGVRQNLTAGGGQISLRGMNTDPGAVYACMNYAYRESKQHRHGELVDFNGSIHMDLEETLEMVNTIRDCIVDGCRGFSIRYQPVVDVKTERPIGVEALVRWEGEPYGAVEPMEFIPILEKDFVFEELGYWIMQRVFSDGVEFLEKDPDFMVSLNVSAVQFEDEYFVDSVLDSLAQAGFPAKNLFIEVTKSCRLLDVQRVKEVSTTLQRHGIRVVIDDFGTGFESIGFLKRLSADCIKLDRELVEGIENDEMDRETIEYLTRCASARGTHVTIKGVETTKMRDILRTYPVSSLQGNLYSKPVSKETILGKWF